MFDFEDNINNQESSFDEFFKPSKELTKEEKLEMAEVFIKRYFTDSNKGMRVDLDYDSLFRALLFDFLVEMNSFPGIQAKLFRNPGVETTWNDLHKWIKDAGDPDKPNITTIIKLCIVDDYVRKDCMINIVEEDLQNEIVTVEIISYQYRFVIKLTSPKNENYGVQSLDIYLLDHTSTHNSYVLYANDLSKNYWVTSYNVSMLDAIVGAALKNHCPGDMIKFNVCTKKTEIMFKFPFIEGGLLKPEHALQAYCRIVGMLQARDEEDRFFIHFGNEEPGARKNYPKYMEHASKFTKVLKQMGAKRTSKFVYYPRYSNELCMRCRKL